MNCFDFSNNYFNKAVVTVQCSLTRDNRYNYFKNFLKGCFGNFTNVKERLLTKFLLRNNDFNDFSRYRENREIVVPRKLI